MRERITISATITYTIDTGHPDIGCMTDWTPEKVYTYSDTYTFDTVFFPTISDMKHYIRRDLLMIAGGGYDARHVHNAHISFNN